MWTCFFALLLAAKMAVTEDFEKGKEIAQAHRHPMVLLFTGSDWCAWSKKLLHDVLEDPRFQETVKNTFVFVNIDFPEVNHQKAALLQENHELKERFHVQNFPAVIMLDPEGFEITRLGYIPGDYGKQLLTSYLQYQELDQNIRHTNLAIKKVSELEELYRQTTSLHCAHLTQIVLEEGVRRGEGVFFPLEKYSTLIRLGKKHSPEAKSLHDLITKRDPENREGSLLRLALLDFQANAEEGTKTPEETVAPLRAFISRFGDKEKDLLHHMISDYFRSHEILAKGE